MLSLASPIPQICISPAPHEEPPVEPYSPFTPESFATTSSNSSSFRPQHLTPPPTHSSFRRNLTPLRHAQPAKGLERVRFEALLQATRERNSTLGSKREQDLRREIAFKVHKNKQLERRALFLSKVLAPPSPTAVDTPKTPPESPAIFHYCFPSPGMESPLSLFESMENGDFTEDGSSLAHEPWVEQVDFRLPEDQWVKKKILKLKPAKAIPSLAEISARLKLSSVPLSVAADKGRKTSTRLPVFLRSTSYQTAPAQLPGAAVEARPSLGTAVDNPQSPVEHSPVCITRDPESAAPRFSLPDPPRSPQMPKLRITTLVVPRTASISPTCLNTTNLLALNDTRERMSKDMLSALKRRTLPYGHIVSPQDDNSEDRKSRRLSSPAELPPLERAGFEHPILALPGGF